MNNNGNISELLFRMLHPDYASLSEEEKKALIYEQRYIEEHKIEIMSEFASYFGKHDIRESEMLSIIVNYGRYVEIAEELFGDILATPYWLNLEENLSRVDAIRSECEEAGRDNPLQLAVKKVWADNIFEALHPDYDSLTPGEQLSLGNETFFIMDHVEEIEKMSEQIYRNGNGEIPSDKALRTAVRQLRAKELFDRLHPDYDVLSPGQRYLLGSEEEFIGDHLDEIDNLKGEIHYTERPAISDDEEYRMAVDRLRTKEIFERLHPEYDSLSDEDRFIIEDEREHILGHLPQITEMQDRYERNGQDPMDALRMAVDYTRANAMFDTLHPVNDSLTPGAELLTMGERDFIFEHIQEIGRLKAEFSLSNPELTPQEALRAAVEQARVNDDSKRM